ncbi:C1 family peptidase [Methanospirillum stamsii]|uniref:Peptidase C1 n=1 Tax=Methanospirillum stamsii TaxID=1277351 RepID=A0A2V2N7X1_9EURY|nr:C1 family peptidase [Methanospirillum stamsii]PWR75949.1 peptidase C1 [Methanospirillum stamsii]
MTPYLKTTVILLVVISLLFPVTLSDTCSSCQPALTIDGIKLQDINPENISVFRNINAVDIGRAMDLSQYENLDIQSLTEDIIDAETDTGSSGSPDAAIMGLQSEIVLAMQEANKNTPRFVIPDDLKDLPPGNFSLLNNLVYVPDEQDQTGGSPEHCGNCWVFADTAALQLDLSYQKNITDRLSVQYFNSNYHNGTGIWACCGGNPTWFADFYNTTKMAIPWNNTNASFADSSQMCEQGESTTTPASSIAKDPFYTIENISAQMIATNSVYEEQYIGNETAIQSIKAALYSGKGVIIIYTPDNWDPFMDFWTNQSENAIFTPVQDPNATENDGGHVMLIIGYDDTDPEHSYWTVLNSWGAPQNRPDGLFRLNMGLDYTLQNPDGVNAYEFYILDVVWK